MSSQNPRLMGPAAALLLAWGILHIVGGLYNFGFLFGGGLLESLGVPPPEASGAPRLARAALGISAVWSGSIIGLGVEACVLARGAFRRGERWAWLLTVATLGPTDTGASLFGAIAQPPMPYPVVLPLGLSLFLGSVVLAVPAVWGKKAA